MTEPLTPAQVIHVRETGIPDFVVAAFNQLIQKKFGSTKASISVDEAVPACLEQARLAGVSVTRSELFEKHWMDVEPMFRAKGWTVTYDRKDYNESGPDWYHFSAPRSR